ncbi:MAG: MFS transporter [Chloroflexi bacterium]|nr:MFS transporter [Chloroflexota bacterium]
MKLRAVIAASLGHFIIDTFSNTLPIMYTLLVTSLGLSYSQVALIATTYSTAGSLSQPLFGHLGDKFGGRWLAAVSIVWATSMMSLTGLASSYPLLLLLVALAGLGSGAYHPQGAMNAALAGGIRRGAAVSIFSFGGSAGAALGPLVGAFIFSGIGVRGTPIFAVPGLIVAILFYYLVGQLHAPKSVPIPAKDPEKPDPIPWRGAGFLVAVVSLRGWAYLALVTFIPLLFRQRGFSVDQASKVLFAFLVAAAAGVLLGGWLSDIVTRRIVTLATLAISPVSLILILHDSLLLSIAAVFFAGLLLESSVPVTVVMAQELLPHNVGVASGHCIGTRLRLRRHWRMGNR